jgi:GNAT superfamily N-acetyltransferase
MRFEFMPFTPSDIREFSDMVFSLYGEDDHGEVMTEEKIGRTLETFASNPERGGVVLFRFDTEIVGYALVIPFWSNEYGGMIAIVDELYVKPIWRRRGCARQFFSFLAGNPREELKALLVSVSPSNVAAGECYKALGFNTDSNSMMVKKLSTG